MSTNWNMSSTYPPKISSTSCVREILWNVRMWHELLSESFHPDISLQERFHITALACCHLRDTHESYAMKKEIFFTENQMRSWSRNYLRSLIRGTQSLANSPTNSLTHQLTHSPTNSLTHTHYMTSDSVTVSYSPLMLFSALLLAGRRFHTAMLRRHYTEFTLHLACYHRL